MVSLVPVRTSILALVPSVGRQRYAYGVYLNGSAPAPIPRDLYAGASSSRLTGRELIGAGAGFNSARRGGRGAEINSAPIALAYIWARCRQRYRSYFCDAKISTARGAVDGIAHQIWYIRQLMYIPDMVHYHLSVTPKKRIKNRPSSRTSTT